MKNRKVYLTLAIFVSGIIGYLLYDYYQFGRGVREDATRRNEQLRKNGMSLDTIGEPIDIKDTIL